MRDLIKLAIIWLVISIILSSSFVFFTQISPKIMNSSVFIQALSAILGSILGVVGALIGYTIRRFAKPSAYASSDKVIKIVKNKFFWNIVPQSIGCILGIAIGISLPLMG